MKPAPRNILFLTWDGPETRYLERLFLPILAGLRERGFRPHVLQFGWGEAALFQRRGALCAAAGIPYRAQPILRRGGAAGPFLTALAGARPIRRAVAEWGIDTLLPRSLMPALATLRLRPAERAGLKILFDADGLPADERVDFAGLSPLGATYRLLRDIEMRMLLSADAVLTRTPAARDILCARAGTGLPPGRVHRVTNGVDASPFAAALASLPPRDGAGPVLCYCGSIGPQYRLPEMLEVARRLRARLPDLRFRLLSPATAEIGAELARQGFAGADWIEARAVAPEAVPGELARCDIGLALRQPAFSTRAVLPIKLGEYLLAGLPVIGTPGIGDTAALEAEGLFRSAEAEALDATLDWLVGTALPGRDSLRRRAHAAGLQGYSLTSAVESYAEALASLAHAGD